jgi:hypothetical protein
LSITDILVGVFALIEALFDVFVQDKLTINPTICKFVSNQHFVYMGVISSYTTIIYISFLRYFGISKPLKSLKYRNMRNLKYVIPLIWIISLVSVSPRFYADFSRPGCAMLIAIPLTSKIAGGISIVFRGIVLPVTTLSYTYWKIRVALDVRHEGIEISSRQQAAVSTKKKAARVLGFVILAFVVCSVPHYMYAVARSILSFHHLASHVYVEMFLFCVFIAGSSVNPFLYWFHCRRFRQTAFKHLGRFRRIAPR